MESSYPSPPEAGDDSVFYDSDDTNGETNDYIREYKEPANHPTERALTHTDDSTNENLRSPGNQNQSYQGRLHPLRRHRPRAAFGGRAPGPAQGRALPGL